MEAEYKQLPKLGKIITELADKHQWKDEFASAVAVGTHGQETVAA